MEIFLRFGPEFLKAMNTAEVISPPTIRKRSGRIGRIHIHPADGIPGNGFGRSFVMATLAHTTSLRASRRVFREMLSLFPAL